MSYADSVVTDAMIAAFAKAADGIGAEKGSFLWDMTKRGLHAALAIRPDAEKGEGRVDWQAEAARLPAINPNVPSELFKWLVTIDAHATVLLDGDPATDVAGLAYCIKTNVRELEAFVLPLLQAPPLPAVGEASGNPFAPDEYAHTAALLRSPAEFIPEATLSNNFNIILAALDACASATPHSPTDARREVLEEAARFVEGHANIPQASREVLATAIRALNPGEGR